MTSVLGTRPHSGVLSLYPVTCVLTNLGEDFCACSANIHSSTQGSRGANVLHGHVRLYLWTIGQGEKGEKILLA